MTFVQIRKNGVIGELVLCSPTTLNALTHADIKALRSGLALHEADESVRAIVIRSDSDKAFCAGGDMKRIREHILAHRFDLVEHYFKDEYALNLSVSRCKKPYIALMKGIAMGGGLGISVHGNFRVVSENSLLAMPESRIGFFPDVGASYFLPRLPQRAGYWLGLTAASVKGHQAVCVGLATHYVRSDRFDALQYALQLALQALDNGEETNDNALATVRQTLRTFAKPFPDDDYGVKLAQRAQWFADTNIDAIRKRLCEASQTGNEDATHLLSLLDAGSPYSIRSTAKLLIDASNRDLPHCLALELELAAEAVRYPDCPEGVRAVLVDKDRNPAWTRAQ